LSRSPTETWAPSLLCHGPGRAGRSRLREGTEGGRCRPSVVARAAAPADMDDGRDARPEDLFSQPVVGLEARGPVLAGRPRWAGAAGKGAGCPPGPLVACVALAPGLQHLALAAPGARPMPEAGAIRARTTNELAGEPVAVERVLVLVAAAAHGEAPGRGATPVAPARDPPGFGSGAHHGAILADRAILAQGGLAVMLEHARSAVVLLRAGCLGPPCEDAAESRGAVAGGYRPAERGKPSAALWSQGLCPRRPAGPCRPRGCSVACVLGTAA